MNFLLIQKKKGKFFPGWSRDVKLKLTCLIMEYMIVHIKISIYLIVFSFLLSACGMCTTPHQNSDAPCESVSIDNLFGTWASTTFLAQGIIQANDFYPEEYIGNTMSIEQDSFNMGHWEGILPSAQVEQYVLEEKDTDSYFVENRIEGDFEIDAPTLTILSYEKVDGGGEEIGIVLDDGHLICPTGSGWYLYEPVVEDRIS